MSRVNVGHMPVHLQKGLLGEMTQCLKDMDASGWIRIDKDGDISPHIDGDNKPAIFSELSAIISRWTNLHFVDCGLIHDGVMSEREIEMMTKFVYAPSPPTNSTVGEMDDRMKMIQDLEDERAATLRETIRIERNSRRKEAVKKNISKEDKYVESNLKPASLPVNYRSPPTSDNNSSGDEKLVKKVKRRDMVIENVAPSVVSKNSAKKAAKMAAKLSRKK